MKQKQKKNSSYWVCYDHTIVYYLWEKHFQQYFKGVAVCQPDDTFDPYVGVKIARRKAVTKMHSWMANLYEDRLELIQKMKDMESKVIQQRDYWRNKAEESFAKLVNTLNELK